MRKALFGLLGLSIIIGVLFAFGGEGTNGNYFNPYDVRDETHRIVNLAQGAVTDSIEVHNDATNYTRRVAFNQFLSSIAVPTPYSGTTNASGVATFTYPSAYAVVPNVQFVIVGGDVRDTARITASTTGGCSITVQRRVDVIGLLPTYNNVNGASVDIIVTKK